MGKANGKTMKMKKTKTICLCLTVCFALNSIAHADMLDLTAKGSYGTINGAFFQQIDEHPQGTGNFKPFVRIGPDSGGLEAGYGTFGEPEFQTKGPGGSNWCRSVPLSDVPIINGYHIFELDIDQAKTPEGRYLSLDELEIYLENNNDIDSYPGDFSTPIWDLDAGGDNWVKLNYELNPGNGWGDIFVRIPAEKFTGGEWLYLYSMFGTHNEANDGFEEWAYVVPEPATICLLGLGTLGLIRRRRKK